MQLSLTSIGGFAGPAAAEVRRVDTHKLAPAAREHLEALARAAQLHTLPPALLNAHPKPWDFEHEIRMDDGSAAHSVRFHDASAPPALAALKAALQRLPRNQP